VVTAYLLARSISAAMAGKLGSPMWSVLAGVKEGGSGQKCRTRRSGTLHR
jgi:hypothetical protein